MLKPTLLLFTFVLLGQLSQAQQKESVDTIILPQSVSQYIPVGYTVIDTAIGYLDLDKNRDIMLVLKAIGEDTAQYTWDYKRPLILLLGKSDKKYIFATRNDNIIPTLDRSNPFGDSYKRINISNGVFTVRQISGGSSFASEEELTFKFSLKKKNWYLHKVVEGSWDRNRTQKGIRKGDEETKTYNQKHFGIISFAEYKDWR